MRKIFAICLLAAACAALPMAASAAHVDLTEYGTDKPVSTLMNQFKPNNVVVTKDGDYSLAGQGGAKQGIMDLVTRLTQLGALLAIGGIVYSGFLMVSSAGDDSKASRGKKGLIWSAAGFAAMILAAPMVNAIVNMAYGTYGGK